MARIRRNIPLQATHTGLRILDARDYFPTEASPVLEVTKILSYNPGGHPNLMVLPGGPYTAFGSFQAVFSDVEAGDILRFAGGPEHEYALVGEIEDERVSLTYFSEDEIRAHFKALAYAQRVKNKPPVLKTELYGLWRQWFKTVTVEDSISGLAKILSWHDKALQRTVVERQHPPDTERKLGKIKKIRTRAGHSSTPAAERETCLRMAVVMTETLIAPKFKGKIDAAVAIQNKTVGRALPKTSTASRSAGPPNPGSLASNEVRPLADAIMTVLGSRAKDRQSSVRISMRHPDFDGVLFAIFSKKKEVQLMCPLLGKLGVTRTDSMGTHMLVFPKPIGPGMFAEIEGWAKKVKDLLA